MIVTTFNNSKIIHHNNGTMSSNNKTLDSLLDGIKGVPGSLIVLNNKSIQVDDLCTKNKVKITFNPIIKHGYEFEVLTN